MPQEAQIAAITEAAERLERKGQSADALAWPLLSGVGVSGSTSADRIASLKSETQLEGDGLERLLIERAARTAISKVAALKVDDAVKQLLGRDLPVLHQGKTPMDVTTYHFDRAAKIATLRRFPAGPMEWEISGLPRSWFAHGGVTSGLRLASFIVSRALALKPYFFMHTAPNPRSRLLTSEREVLRAYYRMARALDLQPEVQGVLGRAWFFDPAAVRDYPHLEVLNRPFRQGGIIVTLGIAPPSSGVLEGDRSRRAEYLVGKLRYRYGLAVWPRASAVEWAAAHPEWG
jgi:hypothetical protein